MTLRDLRDRHALTQKELAKRIGATQYAITSWETGRHMPSAHYRRQLAEFFGLRPWEIKFAASRQATS